MTPDGIEAALAAGLAAHEDCVINGDNGPGAVTSGMDTWSCGLTLPFRDDLDDAERAHVAAALLPVVTQAQADALREAAQVWRDFVADGRCPTCQMGRSRETVGMVCQTCGTDYARADDDDE